MCFRSSSSSYRRTSSLMAYGHRASRSAGLQNAPQTSAPHSCWPSLGADTPKKSSKCDAGAGSGVTTEQRCDEPVDSAIAGATSAWRKCLLAFQSWPGLRWVDGEDVLVAMRVCHHNGTPEPGGSRVASDFAKTVYIYSDLTCKRGSVGQSEGLSIPRSSVRFRLNPIPQILMNLNFIDPPTRVLNYF